MSPTDLTPEILRSLRGDLREATARVDRLAERVDDLLEWVDGVEARLSGRLDGFEETTTGIVTTLARTVSGLAEVTASHVDLPPRMDACEEAIVRLRAKVER